MNNALKFASPLLRQHFVKELNCPSRNLSLLRRLLPRSVLLKKSDHEVIYEFPYVSHTSYFIRTKLWVPAVVTFLTPIGLLFKEGRLTMVGILLSSWLHALFVHTVSKQSVNLIGKIYVNKEDEKEELIISAIDVDGNRIDRFHKPRDLIMCDFSNKIARAMGFVTIFAQDSSILYQLNIGTCKILNKEKYLSLFGGRNYLKDKIQTL